MSKDVTERTERHRIGDRLKQVRGNTNQADFSKALGVNQNTIGRYERGERTPDIEYVAALCKATGISPRWLILGEEPMYDADREIALEIQPDMKAQDLHGHSPSHVRGGYREDAVMAFLQVAIKQAAELVARHPEVPDDTPLSRLRQMEQERDEARRAELRAKDEALKAKDETLKAKDKALEAKDKALEAKDEALEAVRALAARTGEDAITDAPRYAPDAPLRDPTSKHSR